uniref:Uncharacterized protein n=1 Tax=Rhizophora mucronata TaxID=61149 RepID=A0A2P2QUD3_RHIMU
MKETYNDDRPAPAAFKARKRRRCCLITGGVILLLLFLLFLIILILALTMLKPKQPRTRLLSATLDGISPRISFPDISIQLNITVDLKILVQNRNHASFKHGPGKSLLYYRGHRMGEADLYPGLIPSMGSETLPCRLTIYVKVDAKSFASNINFIRSLIRDVLRGQLVIETNTRIPGRVRFLGGLFKKHAVATSNCRFTIAIPAMEIQSQQCKNKAKL